MDLSEYPEKYWHFRITKKIAPDINYVINDATINEIYKEVIEPYIHNKVFTVSGKIIKNRDEVDLIQVVQTPFLRKKYLDDFYNDSSFFYFQDDRLFPFEKGKDYTNQLIIKSIVEEKIVKMINGNKIFIVHGHDEQARDNTARFIDKLGLESIILSEQASKGKTVIEKFEEHSSEVAFAVVLLTPDDFGGSKQTPDVKNDRARQNVIFELGYFLGKLGREHVCALRKGTIENPSDYTGVIYIDMDKAGAWKYQLAKEMKTAGLQIDMNKMV